MINAILDQHAPHPWYAYCDNVVVAMPSWHKAAHAPLGYATTPSTNKCGAPLVPPMSCASEPHVDLFSES